MAEAVLGRGAAAHLDDEVEPLQLRERRLHLLARQHLLEQRQAEGAAGDGGGREHLARRRVEPVEPRLQRALDERRDDELVGVDGELEAAVLARERAALDEVAQRLLEEERVAAGALGEQVGDLLAAAPRRAALAASERAASGGSARSSISR